jgi:type I restriction enzyme S subunit
MTELIKIGDFANVITGGTPSTLKNEYWQDGDIPWLNSGELNQDIVTFSSNFITSEGLKNSAAKLMPPETVLIALTGATTGKIGYLTFEACANQSVTGILPSKRHFPKFLYYYLNSIRNRVLKDSYGGAQPHISQGYVKNLKIPLPPLEAQKKISAILDKADELRQNDKKILKKYDKLAQSVFLEMFGDPVRNEKRWEIIKFYQLVSNDCPLTYGIVQPGDEFNDGTIIVRPVDLVGKFVSTDELKRIDPAISGKYKRTILKGNELLLSVRGSVGSLSYATEDLKGANVTRGIVPIWANSSMANIDFIYGLFSNLRFKKKLQDLSKGATLIQLNLSDLRELEVIHPPLELQNKFSKIIIDIDCQRQLTQQSIQKSEDLFQSLLQRAFRGELL